MQRVSTMSKSNSSFYFLIFICLFISGNTMSQGLVINEVMTSNSNAIYDEDGDTPDWIEIFNAGAEPVNLDGYHLSDTLNPDLFWTFPAVILNPAEHLLVFASDKNRTEIPLHWETVVDMGDTFRYIVPTEEPAANWRTTGFDDSSWLVGKSGFGYGDGDDSTIVENVLSVFYRTTFNVDDPANVVEAILHMDYDDAFVAFINGVEIARGNIWTFWTGNIPAFDTPADNGNHEALMYTGGQPEPYPISNISDLLVSGENVFAVQAHNSSTSSADLTSIPFLSLGYSSSQGGSLSPFVQLTPNSLHTDFKISSDGETVYLTNPTGEVVDSLLTGKLIANVSIGRSPDGSENIVYYNYPTPGSTNSTTGFQSFAGNVEFSSNGGKFNSSFQLELSTSNPTDSIFYTLDGSEPTNADSYYQTPISLNSTTTVRARVVKSNSVPGVINSATYLFNVDHDIAVISIVTDPVNLWDYDEGMYVLGPGASSDFPYFGANFWEDWEKPAHIEMYEPDGSQAFSINAGIKIFGGWSRANAQKSLTIHARKSYGDGSIKYKIFPEKDLEEFSSIVLRNSGNDWNGTMFRDGVLSSLFHESVDRQAFRPAVVYINGEYWGIQNIREKVNEHFLADNHAINAENLSLLELEGLPVYGDEESYQSLIAFVLNNDLSVLPNYQYVESQMDIRNFIYYQIGNIYVDNTDWPGNNIKYWRENSEDGRWRWICFDTDFGFGIYGPNRETFNTLAFALDPFGPSWPNPPWSTLLFRRLMQNQEFKELFINTFADQMNTTLMPIAVKEKIHNASNATGTEIFRHMVRWGGSTSYRDQKIQEMKQFADARPSNVRNHIRQQFGLPRNQSITINVNDKSLGHVQLNTLELDNYPWTGIYFEGVPVKLTAKPEVGYRFVKWEGDVVSSNASIEVNLTKNTSIKAVFAFEDNELTSMVINEINYNSADDFDTDDWVELYNRGSQTVDISGWVLKDDDDAHEFNIPDNTIVPSGGYLIVSRSVNNFSALWPDVSPVVGDMNFGLSGSGDCVRLFNDEGTMVDNVCFGSASPWPVLANGGGATLALDNPFADNLLAENWYALTNNGNPGEENRLVSGFEEGNESIQLMNYPNPFTGFTTLQYELPESGQVKIELLDQHGRTVKTLVNDFQNSGNHNMDVDFSGGKGMFFIRMTNRHGVAIHKILSK